MSKTGSVGSSAASAAATARVQLPGIARRPDADRDQAIRPLREWQIEIELRLMRRRALTEAEPAAMPRVGGDADDGDR